MSTATASYKGHRYPAEIINHCVWLYFRFPLSFREVEELMLARGVAVSYEMIAVKRGPKKTPTESSPSDAVSGQRAGRRVLLGCRNP